MSRHELTPLDPNHRVTVGWDRPLGSFFAIVVADEDDDPLLWLGGTPGEIVDPKKMLAKVAAFAVVPAELVDFLLADQAEEGTRPAGIGPSAAFLAQQEGD